LRISRAQAALARLANEIVAAGAPFAARAPRLRLEYQPQ